MKIASAVGQSLKSGNSVQQLGWVRILRDAVRADRRHRGCCSAKYAAANAAVIVMPNWIRSVTSTPHKPAIEAKKIGHHRA